MKKNLTKRERLRKKSDIAAVLSSHNKVSCSGVKLKYIRNGLEWNRIAITLRKKFGTAVFRNRAKRIAKEVYRNIKPLLRPGYDMIIILYPGEYDYGERKTQFSSLYKKAGLLAEDC
ncbi:MAG: ribonuclease P protein component [Spirochaetota bacterium]